MDVTSTAARPKNWLVESILVTIFCFAPFGIVGIVYSANVNSRFDADDLTGAERASNEARKWTRLGFFTGIILYLLLFGFVLAPSAGFNMAYGIIIVVLLLLSVALTYDTSWMNLLQGLRNELVFADRHKDYGAYELRTDYNRRLGLAMLVAVAFFALVVGAPFVISKMGGKKVEEKKVEVVDVNLDLFQDKPDEPPPPPEVVPPPQPKIETVQFTAVEAVDKPVEAPPPTQQDLTETTAGETTQEGQKIDAPPPPPPVEEQTYDLAAVQEQPDFPGGMQKMYDYLHKTIKYPDMEFDAGIQGKVYIQFVVDKDGSVEDAEVRRSVSPGLDKEALRAVKSMPKWSPGKMNGKAVKCRFTIPVDFKLQ